MNEFVGVVWWRETVEDGPSFVSPVDSNTVQWQLDRVNERFSLAELAQVVNGWCDKHRVVPASGQAGEILTERNLRYYRTLGLLDSPVSGGGKGYGEKHRLQLIAIRLLQSQGLPLNRIRALLYGRGMEDLREIEKRGVKELEQKPFPDLRAQGQESWTVYPMGEEFMLISRKGAVISAEVQAQIQLLLGSRESGPLQRVGQN